MSNPELDRWNGRYATKCYLFGETPNVWLPALIEGLPPGRALCVADGEGRNGVWLAEQGWDVLSLDFSPVAQAKAADLAARRGVALNLVQADVHAWDYPDRQFDLVVEVFAQFSTPVDRARKWAGMLRSLKPGGHLALVGYELRQLNHRTGGPSDPARLYTEDLLREAFQSLYILRLEFGEIEIHEGEGHQGPSALLRMLARSKP